MMKYVNECKNPVVITQNGEAKAVLLDVQSYQDMHDAFNLLKLVQLSEKDVRAGLCKDSDQVISELKKRLQKHEKK